MPTKNAEERRRWGKAGVRLTDREAAAIDMRNGRHLDGFSTLFAQNCYRMSGCSFGTTSA